MVAALSDEHEHDLMVILRANKVTPLVILRPAGAEESRPFAFGSG
jgi:hypothetical protein